MKGPIAELCARTITTPRRKRVTNIGTSHHLLLLQKNESSSPSVPKRPAAVLAAFTTPMMILPTVHFRCNLRADLKLSTRCHQQASRRIAPDKTLHNRPPLRRQSQASVHRSCEPETRAAAIPARPPLEC